MTNDRPLLPIELTSVLSSQISPFPLQNFYFSELSSSWAPSGPPAVPSIIFGNGKICCLFFNMFNLEKTDFILAEIEEKLPDFICFQKIQNSFFQYLTESTIIQKNYGIPSLSFQELNKTLIEKSETLIISRIRNISFELFCIEEQNETNETQEKGNIKNFLFGRISSQENLNFSLSLCSIYFNSFGENQKKKLFEKLMDSEQTIVFQVKELNVEDRIEQKTEIFCSGSVKKLNPVQSTILSQIKRNNQNDIQEKEEKSESQIEERRRIDEKRELEMGEKGGEEIERKQTTLIENSNVAYFTIFEFIDFYFNTPFSFSLPFYTSQENKKQLEGPEEGKETEKFQMLVQRRLDRTSCCEKREFFERYGRMPRPPPLLVRKNAPRFDNERTIRPVEPRIFKTIFTKNDLTCSFSVEKWNLIRDNFVGTVCSSEEKADLLEEIYYFVHPKTPSICLESDQKESSAIYLPIYQSIISILQKEPLQFFYQFIYQICKKRKLLGLRNNRSEGTAPTEGTSPTRLGLRNNPEEGTRDKDQAEKVEKETNRKSEKEIATNDKNKTEEGIESHHQEGVESHHQEIEQRKVNFQYLVDTIKYRKSTIEEFLGQGYTDLDFLTFFFDFFVWEELNDYESVEKLFSGFNSLHWVVLLKHKKFLIWRKNEKKILEIVVKKLITLFSRMRSQKNDQINQISDFLFNFLFLEKNFDCYYFLNQLISRDLLLEKSIFSDSILFYLQKGKININQIKKLEKANIFAIWFFYLKFRVIFQFFEEIFLPKELIFLIVEHYSKLSFVFYDGFLCEACQKSETFVKKVEMIPLEQRPSYFVKRR